MERKPSDIKPPKLLSIHPQSYNPKDLNAVSTLLILREEEAGGNSSQLNERVTLPLQAAQESQLEPTFLPSSPFAHPARLSCK